MRDRTSYHDIETIYQPLAVEFHRGNREAKLHRMRQLMQKKSIYAPIRQLAFLNGISPKVA